MGVFAAGQVVLIRYPFSDLSGSKFRPALVLAHAGRGDWIVGQITSNPFADVNAIRIENSDFATGGLPRLSYFRPGKVFTAHESLITSTVGSLDMEAFTRLRDAVVRVIRQG